MFITILSYNPKRYKYFFGPSSENIFRLPRYIQRYLVWYGVLLLSLARTSKTRKPEDLATGQVGTNLIASLRDFILRNKLYYFTRKQMQAPQLQLIKEKWEHASRLWGCGVEQAGVLARVLTPATPPLWLLWWPGCSVPLCSFWQFPVRGWRQSQLSLPLLGSGHTEEWALPYHCCQVRRRGTLSSCSFLSCQFGASLQPPTWQVWMHEGTGYCTGQVYTCLLAHKTLCQELPARNCAGSSPEGDYV